MHTFSIHVCVESLPQTPHIRPSSPTALPLFHSLFLSLSLSLVRALSLSLSLTLTHQQRRQNGERSKKKTSPGD